MEQNERVSDNTCPLLYLQRKLEEKRHLIQLNAAGQAVHSDLFDAHQSNLIAHDHLLSGLAINAMNTIFSVMTDGMSNDADAHILHALRTNGLIRQNQVYNPRSKSVNSMGISDVYCVLLVSSQVLGILRPDENSYIWNL